MATVYRKTDKGRIEIETRVNRLAPRLRSALIVIDGQRSDEQLRGMVAADFDTVIETLLAGGYIELLAVTDPRGASAGRSPPASTAAPPDAGGAAAPSAGQASASPAFANSRPMSGPAGAPFDLNRALAERKRGAVRFLTDRLGPAAEGASLKIEQARSPLDLGAALDKAEALLRQLSGSGAANAFRSQFIETPLG